MSDNTNRDAKASSDEPFKTFVAKSRAKEHDEREECEKYEEREERRRFARLLLTGALVAYAAPFPFVLWNYLTALSLKRVPVRPLGLGTRSQVEATLSGRDHFRLKFGDKNVILLRQEQTLKAFNLRCTHAGCTVEWQPTAQKFVCHCHGGEFRADGSVARLPPTEPLEELTVRLEQGAYTLYDIPVRQ